MRQNLHHHYNQLTEEERTAVDQVFNRHTGAIWAHFDHLEHISLAGDDRCERVVDAVARWVIESRKRPEDAELEPYK